MKIYWTNSSIPELYGLSNKQQLEFRRAAFKTQRKNPRIWLGLGLMILVNLISLIFLIKSNLELSYLLLLNSFVTATTALVWNQYIIRIIRPSLKRYRMDSQHDYNRDHNDYFVPLHSKKHIQKLQ